MKRVTIVPAFSTLMLCALPPAHAASPLTPGLYEYTIKMNMPGAPANMPAQISQRCLNPKDVDSNKAFEMPADRNSDCQVKDMTQSGGRFSYRMSCTKPQQMNADVKGAVTANSMTMDMTMTMAGAPGPMTQSITARRIGDCKQ